LADINEGLIQNNLIEGFRCKYSFFGIVDTDIEYCKVGIMIQKPILLEVPTPIYDGGHPIQAHLFRGHIRLYFH